MSYSPSWYAIEDIDQLDTPAMVVFPDRIKANILAALEMIGDPARLRPHIKTHKSREVIQMMLEAGIWQFKCATIAEAELLAQSGAKDILLAYQPVGPKARRLLALTQLYPEIAFGCLVDHPEAAKDLSALWQSKGQQLNVYLDLNLGTNRTGIAPGEEAKALVDDIQEMKGLVLKGVHAYDGHFRQPNFEERKAACDLAFAPAEDMLNSLQEKGYTGLEIIAGGTPTFPIHLQRNNVICSPGTFVYWDIGYGEILTEQPFQPAALVITRVISLPAAGLVTVDLGHKSIASENPLANRVRFLNKENLIPVSQSEEHLVLQDEGASSFKPGDMLFGIPFHICPTVALYDTVHAVREGRLAEEWKIQARDKKLSL
ncbi:MAG TPA: D-TA family PLP-dependent enzyme [Cyclobacteriaceae bacterium]|nr:D-TA family PLP-dependent enzyme [Cyclobacteriaceae bacterium]